MQVLLGGFGGFLGILAIAALSNSFVGHISLPLLLGCFGASATLLFGGRLLCCTCGYLVLKHACPSSSIPGSSSENHALVLSCVYKQLHSPTQIHTDLSCAAGMPTLPVAQPRNIFGGMIISCAAGLFWRTLLGNHVWVAASLGVALSIVGMQVSATLHRAPLP